MKQNDPGSGIQMVMAIDQQMRKIIPDYYTSLKQMNDPKKAVELLAEHASILIEMINEFKKEI